jgi:hypothetical protein
VYLARAVLDRQAPAQSDQSAGSCRWNGSQTPPDSAKLTSEVCRLRFGLQADSRRLSRDFEAKLGVGSLNAALAVNTVGMWPHPTARATRTRPAIAARRADRYGFPAPLPRCHRSHLCGGRQRAGSPAYRSRVRARPNRSARPRPAGRVRPQARVQSRPARRATAALSTPWYGAPGRTAQWYGGARGRVSRRRCRRQRPRVQWLRPCRPPHHFT